MNKVFLLLLKTTAGCWCKTETHSDDLQIKLWEAGICSSVWKWSLSIFCFISLELIASCDCHYIIRFHRNAVRSRLFLSTFPGRSDGWFSVWAAVCSLISYLSSQFVQVWAERTPVICSEPQSLSAAQHWAAAGIRADNTSSEGFMVQLQMMSLIV